MKKKTLYLFDLDGVLINSKNNMKVSWNSVLKKINLKITFKKYFSLIGNPFLNILKKLRIDEKHFKIIETEYGKNSIKNMNKIKLYPKVKYTLNKLLKEKKIIGILTSKDKVRTRIILRKFKLNLKIVLCPTKGKLGKPNPYQIINLIEKKKIRKDDVVYIGDMPVDKLTAQNAGIDYIHCNYGYSPRKFKNKFSINRLDNIIKYNMGI